MIGLQPYHAGGYPPPGRRWPQLGNPALEAALGGADSIRSKLQAKRDTMQSFHLGRLQDQGIMPLGAPAANAQTDPSQVGVAEFDHFTLPPAQAVANQGGTDISVPESPELIPATPDPFPFSYFRGTAPKATPKPKAAMATQEPMATPEPKAAAPMTTPVPKATPEPKAAPALAPSAEEPLIREVPQAVTYVGPSLLQRAQRSRENATAMGSAVSSAVSGARNTVGPPIVYGANAIAHLAGVLVPPIAEVGLTGAMALGNVAADGLGALGSAAIAAAPPTARFMGRAASMTARGVGRGSTALGNAMAQGASRGLEMARARLEQSELSLSDLLTALNEMRSDPELADRSYSAYNALTDGSYAALPDPPPRRRNRMDTPPPRRSQAASSSSAAPAAAATGSTPENSFSTVAEWLEFAGNKGKLREELSKRPEWRLLTDGMNSVDQRNKLKKMSREDMAKMLMQLDAS